MAIFQRIGKRGEVWRYFSFRVFCGSDPLERGIVKWYIASDNPELKPMWITNYHIDLPYTKEIALKNIDDTMKRIAMCA